MTLPLVRLCFSSGRLPADGGTGAVGADATVAVGAAAAGAEPVAGETAADLAAGAG